MPIYLPALKGITLSEALAEAAAIAPIERAILETFELRHISLEVPVRVVNDFTSIFATLESDAPANASQTVEFIAAAVKVNKAEESDAAAAPEITLQIDNVSGVYSEALRIARNSNFPNRSWDLTYRLYASDDLSGPALLPVLSLYVLSVDLTAKTALLHCKYADIVNIGVPRLPFRIDQYPGLDPR